MADTNTNEGSARANDKQQSIYTTKQKKSLLTIRTRCVGGTTRVCLVHVCFPVCALMSFSAAVPVKVKHAEVREGRASFRAS